MKNKKFDTVKMIRSIRDKNYEQTKDMTPQELLEWYRQKGRAATTKLRKDSIDTTATS